MKKILFLSMFCMASCFQLAFAQSVITCTGSKTGAKVTYLSTTNGEVKLKVDWNEGSTFAAQNLELTNGTCLSCPNVGGIGKDNPVQTWTIKQTDPNQPIAFAWGTPSTKTYCGTGSATIFDPAASYNLQTEFRGAAENLEGNKMGGALEGGNAFMDKAQSAVGQKWKLVSAGGGFYRLQTEFLGAANSLECNGFASTFMNGSAFMSPTKDVTGQLWKIEPAGNGFYRLKTKLHGDAKCLEGNEQNGAVKGGAAFMDDVKNAKGQFWKFVKVK